MTPFDLSVFAAPLTLPELRNGPILLRGFGLSDLPLVRQATEDSYIPSITSVPTTYSDDSGRAFHRTTAPAGIRGTWLSLRHL